MHACSLPSCLLCRRPPNSVPTGAAAFVEILSEPLYILAAARLQFGLRVAVETAGMSAKGLLTLALVRRPDFPPAIAFSWAQLAYAGITLLGYAAYFLPQLLRQAAVPVQPSAVATAKQPAAAAGSDGEILRLAGTFTLQVGGICKWNWRSAQPCAGMLLGAGSSLPLGCQSTSSTTTAPLLLPAGCREAGAG